MKQRDSVLEMPSLADMAIDLGAILGKLTRRLREEARAGDFTLSQRSMLGRLEREGPATVTALAKGEGVRPQSAGATLAVLEAAGMVAGAPDPADGRQTILSLTPAAREMVKASRAARQDWLLRTIRRQLTPQEQATLAAGMDLLKRIAES
jgi:DNA-binding MarR family transcriptional regulator